MKFNSLTILSAFSTFYVSDPVDAIYALWAYGIPILGRYFEIASILLG